MSPTVSVIIPVYNRFQLLKYSVESVLRQTVPVLEVILVDDGSFDGTSELLPRYIAEHEAWRQRVRYFYQENKGPGAARNVGLLHAKGEWLAFNDNDDLWLPQKLEWQLRALSRFGETCGVCFTDAWFMNNPHMKMTLFQLAGRNGVEDMGLLSNAPKYLLEKGAIAGNHPVWVQTLVLRADVAHQVGGFDSSLQCGEDDDFVFRLACQTNFCFVGMPMVLIERTLPQERHIGASRSWDREDVRLRMAQCRFEKRLQMDGLLRADVRRLVRRDLAEVHSGWANWFLKHKEYDKARAASKKAVQLGPSIGRRIKWTLLYVAPDLARRAVAMRMDHRAQKGLGVG